MGDYTRLLDMIQSDIHPEEADYEQKLIQVMESFRDSDEALDAFLTEQGYTGSLLDCKEKTEYIKAHFHQAGIAKSSNRHKWYANGRLGRKSAFELCFAFELSVEEAGEFFRRVCLQRSFDCHNIEEAIYYYGIKNHMPYAEVAELLSNAPEAENGNIGDCKDILYTASIVEQLEQIEDPACLIAYFKKNLDQFSYNNATARRTIRSVWDEISRPDGLAFQERKRLYNAFDEDAYAIKNNQASLAKASTENVKEEQSIWNIYLQILQLDHTHMQTMNSDRSLKPILRDNPLLHRLAEQEFPDRQSITKILAGKKVKDESVRKTMIFLLFYRFWIKRMLEHEKSGAIFQASIKDQERCFESINQFLVEAGYPELYSGNPYDWIFLFMIQDDYPLDTFRQFISLLYIYKEDSFTRKET